MTEPNEMETERRLQERFESSLGLMPLEIELFSPKNQSLIDTLVAACKSGTPVDVETGSMRALFLVQSYTGDQESSRWTFSGRLLKLPDPSLQTG